MFIIRDSKTGKPWSLHEPWIKSHKTALKAERDRLNGGKPDGRIKARYVISRMR